MRLWSVLVAALGLCLAGCATAVAPGLANAPILGGATPETTIHDVIANGHDACEQVWFPEGAVLRRKVPPCDGETRSMTATLAPGL
jgi:hypothetical protein